MDAPKITLPLLTCDLHSQRGDGGAGERGGGQQCGHSKDTAGAYSHHPKVPRWLMDAPKITSPPLLTCDLHSQRGSTEGGDCFSVGGRTVAQKSSMASESSAASRFSVVLLRAS